MNLRKVQKTQASYDSEHWAHKPGRETIYAIANGT